jgi:hypothetical protein
MCCYAAIGVLKVIKSFKEQSVETLAVLGVLGIIALCVGGCIAKCAGGVNWKYSEGSRSGVVQKISKKGVIWQTWEGELNLGYNTSRSNENGGLTIAPAIFYFSCSSDDAAKKIQEAERNGDRVTLEYSQYFLRGWKYGSTSYDVTGVVSNRYNATIHGATGEKV